MMGERESVQIVIPHDIFSDKDLGQNKQKKRRTYSRAVFHVVGESFFALLFFVLFSACSG
jgi:hypothetical protein